MKNKFRLLTILALIVVSLFGLVSTIQAQITITIDGNGDNSDNNVSVSSDDTTQVNSSNEAEVNNDVSVEANTGDNNANDNTGGDVTIDTGNVDSQTDVVNTVNTVNIDTSPCCADVTAQISNNGSNSTNTVDLTSNSDTTVNIVQTATVNNNVNVVANTGRNTANNNGGSATIQTGNITGHAIIQNSINVADIDIEVGGFANMYLSIFGNGSGSVNNASFNSTSNVLIDKLEQAFIDNFLNTDLDTGENQANGNLGAVLIGTGDIAFMTSIVNDPINSNDITINNCCPDDPGEQAAPPSNGGIGGNGDDNGNDNDNDKDDNKEGEVLGAAAGEILPATGGVLNHWAVLTLSLLLLLNGLLLKVRGRKKALAFA